MNPKLIKKVYDFTWPKDSSRYALITFAYNGEKEEFEFSECEYHGVGTKYDLDDWEFLSQVSWAILNLVQKEIK